MICVDGSRSTYALAKKQTKSLTRRKTTFLQIIERPKEDLHVSWTEKGGCFLRYVVNELVRMRRELDAADMSHDWVAHLDTGWRAINSALEDVTSLAGNDLKVDRFKWHNVVRSKITQFADQLVGWLMLLIRSVRKRFL